MTTQEIIKVVGDLNWKLWENNPSEYKCFQYLNRTTWDAVEFNGEIIWESENDERDYNEKTHEYEDFEKFLIKKLRDYIKSCQRILKDVK